MKKLIKEIIYSFILLFRPRREVVLLYHSVADNNKYSTVKTAEFERQMKYLYENNLKPLITFDDGLYNFYINAYPILRKYSLSATVFVSTNTIGRVMSYSDGLELPVLDENQIKEMATSGFIQFGSHCHNHTRLTELTDQETGNELKISKDILEKLLNKEVKTFAYPKGAVDERTKRLVGVYYDFAYTIEPGYVTSETDPLLIYRNQIDSSVSLSQFKCISRFKRLKFFGYGK